MYGVFFLKITDDRQQATLIHHEGLRTAKFASAPFAHRQRSSGETVASEQDGSGRVLAVDVVTTAGLAVLPVIAAAAVRHDPGTLAA